jgi:hypothetical protein
MLCQPLKKKRYAKEAATIAVKEKKDCNQKPHDKQKKVLIKDATRKKLHCCYTAGLRSRCNQKSM